jgi:hypothetical protein
MIKVENTDEVKYFKTLTQLYEFLNIYDYGFNKIENSIYFHKYSYKYYIIKEVKNNIMYLK